MKALKFIAIALIAGSLTMVSCKENKKQQSDLSKAVENVADEAAIQAKIASVIATNVVVENGELKLNISRKEFTDKGIPGKYYGEIQGKIKEANKQAKQTGKDVKAVWNDVKKTFNN